MVVFECSSSDDFALLKIVLAGYNLAAALTTSGTPLAIFPRCIACITSVQNIRAVWNSGISEEGNPMLRTSDMA